MNKKLRLLFLLLVMALLTSAPLLAIAATPALEKGTKSIGFSIFPEDRGVGLNGKYFFKPDLALLGEISFAVIDSELNAGTINDSVTTDSETNFFTLYGGLRKYFHTGEVSVFFDGQLFAGFGESKAEGNNNTVSATSESNTRSAGLTAELGAEYFFSASASLSAKYGLQYIYQRTKTDSSTSQGDSISQNTKSSRLSTGEAAIALNYYW